MCYLTPSLKYVDVSYFCAISGVNEANVDWRDNTVDEEIVLTKKYWW